MKNTLKSGDAILWNGEEATLRDLRTPEQQREEWHSHPDVVAGWYESGEEKEPVFEILYEIEDRYGVLHVLIGKREFASIQRGTFFYCCTCIAIRPMALLSKRHQGDCVCVTCVEQPATRRARFGWIDAQEGGEEK